jgi:hypothetical protein
MELAGFIACLPAQIGEDLPAFLGQHQPSVALFHEFAIRRDG